MKNKKSKILLSLLAPVGALSVVSTAALSLASCNDNDKAKDDAVISVVDTEGKASTNVTVKFSNAKLNAYSSIQLDWPSTHSMEVLEVKVGQTALAADKYAVEKGTIIILPDAMTSTNVVIKTKTAELPTGISVVGLAEFKQGEFFGAEDIIVKTMNSKSEKSDPLKWGKDYSISYGGSVIENFDTIGFYFDKQMKPGAHSFTIKYLGESATPISTTWTITLIENKELTVKAISVSLKRGEDKPVYSDETLTDSDFDVKLVYSDEHEEEAWFGYDYYTDKMFPLSPDDIKTGAGVTFTYTGDTKISKVFTAEIKTRTLKGIDVDETPVNVFVGDTLKSSYFDIKCRYGVGEGESRVAVIGKDYVVKYNNETYKDWESIKFTKPEEATLEIMLMDGTTRQGAVHVNVNPTYTFVYEDVFTGYKASIASFRTVDANHMMKLEIPCDSINLEKTKFTIDANMSNQFVDMKDTIAKTLTVYKNSIWTAPVASSDVVFDSSNQKLTFTTNLTGFTTSDKLVITFEVPRLASFSASDWYFYEAAE